MSSSLNNDILNIGLINARSLKNKVGDISDSLISKNINVCAITETWLSPDDNAVIKEYFDMGFNVYHNPRTSGRGGGVGVLIRKGLDASNGCSYYFNSFELHELNLKCLGENFVLSTFYRTGVLDSSGRKHFLEEIEKYVVTKTLNVEHVVLMGDFNIHVENQTDAFANNFIDLMKSMGFDQIVGTPTHIAGGILDLIFIRESTPVKSVTTFNDVMISDHYLLSISVDCKPKQKSQRVERTFRLVANVDVNKFCQELEENLLDGSELSLEETVNRFFHITHSLIDKHAPLKHKFSVLSNKPFSDEAIRAAKRVKRRAERKYRKSGLEQDRYALRVAARNLSKTVQLRSNEFYSKKLQAVHGDAKATYKIVKSLLNKTVTNTLPENKEPEMLANEFEVYFSNRIENICQNMNCVVKRSSYESTNIFEKFDPISEEINKHY